MRLEIRDHSRIVAVDFSLDIFVQASIHDEKRRKAIAFRLPKILQKRDDLVASITVSTTSAAAKSSTTAATGAFFFRLGFIDGKRPVSQGGPIQCLHGFVRFGTVIHFDKGKTFRTTGGPVHDDVDGIDGAVLFEFLAKSGFGGLVREISNIKFHLSFFLCRREL